MIYLLKHKYLNRFVTNYSKNISLKFKYSAMIIIFKVDNKIFWISQAEYTDFSLTEIIYIKNTPIFYLIPF